MLYSEKIKNTDGNVTFYDSHKIVERWGINLLNDKHLLPSVVKLADDWGVKYSTIIAYIKDNNLVKDLFSYTLCGGSPSAKKVAEKAVYEEKSRWCFGIRSVEKIYHDVYVIESKYIHLIFPKIIEYIIINYYPQFAIYASKSRFKKEIKISPKMTIAEIERDYHDCNLTAKDIADLLKCPTFSTEKVNKLAYNIYSDGEDIYYPLPHVMVHGHKYDMSLSIPREAIVKNDWSIVEDKFVFSIIKPNADSLLGRNPNNWYHGKQKDSPYFNCEEVAKIKSLFKVLK
jgi:hypothetical protein